MTTERPKAAAPIRRLNPQRQRLKRFLERRWADGELPISAPEVRAVLGLSAAEWKVERKEIERWIALLGWKECSRKVDRDQPGKRGFWPPLRPVPVVDDWSEYDTAPATP